MHNNSPYMCSITFFYAVWKSHISQTKPWYVSLGKIPRTKNMFDNKWLAAKGELRFRRTDDSRRRRRRIKEKEFFFNCQVMIVIGETDGSKVLCSIV